MSSTDQNTSNTLFTSSPFDGIKGARWHQFEQAFKAGADAEFLGEDDESIWEACTDVDTGGNGAGATAMPAAGAALAKAQRLRKKRQAKAYKFVYRHVDDERIKTYGYACRSSTKDKREIEERVKTSPTTPKAPKAGHRGARVTISHMVGIPTTNRLQCTNYPLTSQLDTNT